MVYVNKHSNVIIVTISSSHRFIYVYFFQNSNWLQERSNTQILLIWIIHCYFFQFRTFLFQKHSSRLCFSSKSTKIQTSIKRKTTSVLFAILSNNYSNKQVIWEMDRFFLFLLKSRKIRIDFRHDSQPMSIEFD